MQLITPTRETIDITPADSSRVYRSISDGSRVTLEWVSETVRDIPAGTTTVIDGITYKLFYPAEITKEHSRRYRYALTMHTEEEALKLIKIKDIGATAPSVEFVLTGTPEDFVRFVARSMGEGWQVGTVLEGGIKTLSFSHDYCHAALARIAEAYDTEWHCEGKTISLGKLELHKSDPLPLSYGLGNGFRARVTRRKSSAGIPAIGRLYIQGGRRNIDPSAYGSSTLRLPKSASYDYEGYTYTTDETGSYIKGRAFGSSLAEGSFDATHIYPRRVGTVTKVETTREGFVDLIDTTIPEELDYTAARIGGEKAVIVFLSGMLTGREIEIAQDAKTLSGYNHKERRFMLVQKEEDGFRMPGPGYMPAEGDTYAVFGIRLPDVYLRSAETEAFHAAVHYLREQEALPYAIDGDLDPVYCHKNWLQIGAKIVPGSYILYSDSDLFPGGAAVRITALSYPFGKPWEADLTLTNSSSPGYLTTEIGKLRAREVLRDKERRDTVLSLARSYTQIEETQALVETAYKEMGGRLKAATLQAMQMVVGSREGQFRFVVSQTDPRPLQVYPLSYDKVGAKLSFKASTLQHLTLGQNASGKQDLTSGGDPSRYRYWTVAGYTSPALEPATPYYVYLKASKTAGTASVVLSDTPLKETTTDYLLLAGILNSEDSDSGSRSYVPLHGFTEITPGQMRTDRVVSADGSVVFDLAGNALHIGSTDGKSYLDYNTLGDGKVRIKGGLMTVGDADTTIEDAIQKQKDAVEAEEQARQKADQAETKALEDAIRAEQERVDALKRELQNAIDLAKKSGAEDVATLTDLLNKANQKLGDLEKQVDKEVSNWFYPGAPSATKLPESEWTTNGLKANHINDTYTSTDKSGPYQGKTWRYDTKFKWVEIADTQIAQAFALASKAQTTADGKSTTYLSKPTKYEEGDTWVLESAQVVNGTTYEKGTCLFATQSSSAFVQAHWVDKLKYISKTDTETKIKDSEAKSKTAWEAYAKAKSAEEREAAKEWARYQDSLLKGQQEAYADGKVTASEQKTLAALEARAKAAEKTAQDIAKAYADGIVTAEEQARIDGDKKALEEAQKRLDELQIGGRNLLIRHDEIKNAIVNIDGGITYTSEYGHLMRDFIPVKAGESLTFKIDKNNSDIDGGAYRVVFRDDNDTKIYRTAWYDEIKTITVPKLATKLLVSYPDGKYNKLERGNKATDWTPAPEDIEAAYQKLIASVDVEFATSASRTAHPTSGWVTQAPATVPAGQYLWQRTKTVLKDGTVEYKGVTCVQGKDGKDGAKGNAGTDGRGISKIEEQYCLHTSRTSAPTAGWTTTSPTPVSGRWIWTRVVITYSDRTTLTTQPVCVTGDPGAPGKDGKDGHTLYVTAKLTGSYRNYKTTGIKLSVGVYYDGAEINIANTTAQFRLRGGVDIYKEWTAWGAYDAWIDANNRNGAPLENEVKVTYKGLTAIAYARLEHVIDGKDGINTSDGLMLYKDPTFATGTNNARRYNNAGGATTSWERIPKPADCPSLSSHVMRYKYLGGGSTSPAYGGFCFRNMTRADAVFVYRIVAKIPEGYFIQHAENAVGNNPVHTWHTPNKGTGRYEEYIYSLRAGKDGSFSTAGYFYFYGGANAPFEVIVSFATCYDMTNAPDYYAKLAESEARSEELRAALDNTNTFIDALKDIDTAIQKGTVTEEQMGNVGFLLQSLKKYGSTQTGLLLSNFVILSNIAGAITAYLSGVDKTDDGKALAMLKAGVRNFGQTTETDSVAIYHDGTAHFGQQYLNGDRLDYKEGTSADPYMSIGKGVITSALDAVLGANNVNTTTTLPDVQVLAPPSAQVSGAPTTGVGKSTPIVVANDNTAVTITLTLDVETGQPDNQYATASFSANFLGVHLGSVAVTYNVTKDGRAFVEQGEQKQRTVTKTIMAPKGTHYIDFSAFAYPKGATCNAMRISVRQVYKTDLRQVLFGDRGLRILQASLRRYFDVDFSRSSSEPFIKIGGGLQVDSINGGIAHTVLAHGWFDKYGNNLRFKSYGNNAVTVSRIGQGYYRLNYPSAWGTSLFFVGSNVSDHGMSGSNPYDIYGNKKVAFSMPRSGYVYVFTSDDASRDDADVYFQIVKY